MKVLMIGLAVLAFGATAWATELANVNGTPITDQDLKAALGGLSEPQRDGILKNMDSKKQILNNIVEQELLTQEGAKEKLDQDHEYKEALDAFRRQFLASRVLQKNLATRISEKAAKKYYEGHKDRYSTDQVNAQHILVSDEATAKEVLKKAQEPNADFQELAEKYSKDPSVKSNRGDLGFFTRDRMVPAFADAAFGAHKGEIVGPVKTQYGYHVIKVVDKKQGKPMEFSEVELRVKNDLRQQLIEDYVAKLRHTAKIAIDEKALKKIQ